MPARNTASLEQVRRLGKCLAEVRYRERAARWAREALSILEMLDVKRATVRLMERFCPDDGTDRNEIMARCHIMLGREAFLAGETTFWKCSPGGDVPYSAGGVTSEQEYFAPAKRALSRKVKVRGPAPAVVGADYGPAVFHFERAFKLLPDSWRRMTPGNRRLAGAMNCDPCLPAFYLAVIALRQNDFTGARSRFKQIREVPSLRGGQRGAVTRFQLKVAAAAFEAVAAILQRRLAEATLAMKRARALDRQSLMVVRNQGYLHEQIGERVEAISCYREVLRWDATDGYAVQRLAALERAGVSAGSAIKLRRPSDFYAKFPEIAGALRVIRGGVAAPKPFPEAALDEVRLARQRGPRSACSPLAKLPPSVKTILRHDRSFALWSDGVPLLRAIVRTLTSRSSSERVMASADIDQLVRTDRWTPYARAFKKLPPRTPVWNDEPGLPACIPLHSDPKGEQRLFLYIGKADDDGEYPIARYAAEPELWVAEASIIQLVVEAAVQAGVAIECAFDFPKLGKRASKRNAIYDERLSEDRRVQAAVSSVDPPRHGAEP